MSDGPVFGTPANQRPDRKSLLTSANAQQCAIAAADQHGRILNQADGTAAQIVGLPGALGDEVVTEQSLRDAAIATACRMAIKRPKRKRQPLTPLYREVGTRWSGSPLLKCRP